MIDQASLGLVCRALAEDLAGYGDITSAWTVPAELPGRAVIEAREELVVCGLPLAETVLAQIEPRAAFTCLTEDGALVKAGTEVAVIEGPARGILGAERTMLNFLIHLSGVATQSRRFALAVEGTGATVVDTRKTIPGLRAWQKRAVVYGGCGNHRFGLFDMALVKNNHLEAAGGVPRPTCARPSPARPTSSCSTTKTWNRWPGWCGSPANCGPAWSSKPPAGWGWQLSAPWPRPESISSPRALLPWGLRRSISG